MTAPAGTWWAEKLTPDYSQGDIFTTVPGAVPVHPLTYLNARPIKGGGPNVYEQSPRPFTKPKGDERDFVLSAGAVSAALVLSYDCELDKNPKASQRVIIAPVFEIDSLPIESRLHVLEQRRFSLMPLPDLPNLGTCYADFRLMQAVQRAHLTPSGRVASMTPEAVARLQAQVVAFFARRALGSTLNED